MMENEGYVNGQKDSFEMLMKDSLSVLPEQQMASVCDNLTSPLANFHFLCFVPGTLILVCIFITLKH